MATLARSFEVNRTVKKLKNTSQLHYAVDGMLSNPINKRYRELFENRLSLVELFKEMSVNLKATDMVRVSNGTKTVEFSKQDWVNIIDQNLSMYNSTDGSENQNVWIKVSGKVSVKEDSAVDTL